MFRLIWIALIGLLMTACNSMKDTADNNQVAVCKELKRQIIFTGATSNNTKATQQRAEMNMLNKSYRNQGCQ